MRVENIITVKAADFEVYEGMITYNRALRCEDKNFMPIHHSILSSIQERYFIRIVGKYYFEFISNEEKARFISDIKTAKAKKLASTYTYLALKNLDEYFNSCYLWKIPKKDLIILDDLIRVPFLHVELVGFISNKYAHPTAKIKKLAKQYDCDLSEFLYEVNSAIKDKTDSLIRELVKSQVIKIENNLSAHNANYLIALDEQPYVYLNLNGLNKIYLSPKLEVLTDSKSDDVKTTSIHGLFISNDKYVGYAPPGDIIEFDQSIIERCNAKIRELYEPRKEFGGNLSADIIKAFCDTIKLKDYKITERYASSHDDLYFVKDFVNNDVFIFTESHAHYSDDDWGGWFPRTPDASISYLIAPKKGDEVQSIRFILKTTNSSLATYYFYVNEDQREMAIYFLLKYFSSPFIKNKRLNFPDYEKYKEFGIWRFYK